MSLLNVQTPVGGALRAVTIAIESGEQLVPITPDVAREFNRNPRTIKRWLADAKIGFPTPIRINNRLYVARSALENFKQSLLSAALPGKAA
jgi:hypothetical protein